MKAKRNVNKKCCPINDFLFRRTGDAALKHLPHGPIGGLGMTQIGAFAGRGADLDETA